MSDGRVREQWQAVTGVKLATYSLIAFLAYASVGVITLSVGQWVGLAHPLWPAAGLAVALVYEWGWRIGPAIALGSFVANTLALAQQGSLTEQSFMVAGAIGIGAAVQAIVAAGLVSHFVGRRCRLAQGSQILTFLLIAGPIASIINASVATLAQVGANLVSADQSVWLWVTWWAGDSIGVIFFAPLVLMLIPTQSAVWEHRRLRIAIPSYVGLAIFVIFYVQTDAQLERESDLRIEQLSTQATAAFERRITQNQVALEGLATYYESSEFVNAEEFRTYTQEILDRMPNLQGLSWNPRVTEDALAEFEQSQQDEQGFVDFQVFEFDENGNAVAVAARPEYFPVAYIEPLESNQRALGFDILSNPTRASAIERALAEGEPAATEPIDLVQETSSQKGMLALVPVRARSDPQVDATDSIDGFVVGVYRLGDLLLDVFGGSAWKDIEIRLVDVTDPDVPEVIVERSSTFPTTDDFMQDAPEFAAGEPFDVYGQKWLVEIRPTTGPLMDGDRLRPLAVDVFGLIMLFLLQAFLLLMTGRESSARNEANKAWLEATTDPLTGLPNRRAFIADLENVLLHASEADRASILLYMDLDGFKAVNDRSGHTAGDNLLRAVAQSISGKVRGADTVARLGGDEFAVILRHCGLNRGTAIAEEIHQELATFSGDLPLDVAGIGVSIGVTVLNAGEDLDDAIRRADMACYAAKRRGGGVEVYESSLQG